MQQLLRRHVLRSRCLGVHKLRSGHVPSEYRIRELLELCGGRVSIEHWCVCVVELLELRERNVFGIC